MKTVTTLCLLLLLSASASAQVPGERNKEIIGKPLPGVHIEKLLNAPQEELNGLESLKGNVVVVEFWATWCAPCIKQIPHLNELVQKYREKPVRFLSVTYESRTKVERFLRRVPIDGWVGLDFDRSFIVDQAKVILYPTTLLIDRQGVVREVLEPEELTEELIERYLSPE